MLSYMEVGKGHSEKFQCPEMRNALLPSTSSFFASKSLAGHLTRLYRFSLFSKNNNAHIALLTMSFETKTKEPTQASNQEGGATAPSGFILKLYQMVNGAPDEVISVSKKIQYFFCENENIG